VRISSPRELFSGDSWRSTEAFRKPISLALRTAMHIPMHEFQIRLERIRVAMAKEGLDALLVYSWRRGQVRYITGYQPDYIANVAAAIIPVVGEPSLIIRFPFDLDRARGTCWFEDVRASGDLKAVWSDVVVRLECLGLGDGRIGIVAADGIIDEFPHMLHSELAETLPHTRLVDASGLLTGLRVCKSSSEFALLRCSARIADVAANAAISASVVGASEHEVVAAAEASARVAGAEDFLVAIANAADQEPIGPPETKPIRSEAMVAIEVAAKVDGYWSQVARTIAVGVVTPDQRRIYHAAHGAYLAALEAAKPGNSLGAVYAAAHSALDAAGFADYLEHDAGHGIGLDLPELPRIERGSKEAIQEGMALVLHPSIRVPASGGAFVGGTILVTSDGPVPIHDIPGGLQ
jgi:Xaa-Pro dipeptidase